MRKNAPVRKLEKAMAAIIVQKVSPSAAEGGMLTAMAAAINPRIAAGPSCGRPTAPGRELVKAITIPITKAPRSVTLIPLETKPERSPEKIMAANEISSIIINMPFTRPALRLGRSLLIWNSCLRFAIAS
jgi:hypothetical protein